jgi:hypothetical protein
LVAFNFDDVLQVLSFLLICAYLHTVVLLSASMSVTLMAVMLLKWLPASAAAAAAAAGLLLL